MRPTPLFLATAAALTVVACSSRDKQADTSAVAPSSNAATGCVDGGGAPTLTAAGVGPLRIGGRVSEVAERCTVRDTSFSLGEGQTENGRVVNLGGSRAVLMVSDDAEPTIERIIVADSSIRTEDGIGIGKNVGALRAAYGRLCAMRGEGNVVVNVSSLPGVSFEVSGGIPVTANVERQPESIPDNATITGIWMYGGRSACGGS